MPPDRQRRPGGGTTGAASQRLAGTLQHTLDQPYRSRRLRRAAIARAARCADCASDVWTRWDAGSLVRVEVHHDDTCPVWRAAGSQPFHELQIVPGLGAVS